MHYFLAFSKRWLQPRPAIRSLCAWCAAVVLSSCSSFQFISAYDEQTDRNATALQRKVDGFLVNIASFNEPPECAYSRHKNVYRELDVDATAMKIRAEAIPNNSITVKQMDELKAIIGNLETLHRSQEEGYKAKKIVSPCIPPTALANVRERANSAFTKMLGLELAKRR